MEARWKESQILTGIASNL